MDSTRKKVGEWNDSLELLALRTLFESKPSAVYVLDTAGHYLAGNPALSRRTGVPWERLREMDFRPTVHPDDIDLVEAEFQAAVSGDVRQYVSRGIRPDGSTFTADVVNIPVSSQGKVVAVVGISHDIDEFDRIRASLGHTEDVLRVALDGVDEAMMFVDHDWRVIFANSKAAADLNKTIEELVGADLWEVRPVGSDLEDSLRMTMRDGKGHARRVFDPSVAKWFEISAFPAGELLGLHARDVTEIEEARIQLDESDRRQDALKLLLDEASDAILMRGLAGSVDYGNHSAGVLLGRTVEELNGLPVRELLGTGNLAAYDVAEAELGRTGKWEGELFVVRPDGEQRLTRARWHLIAAVDGTPDGVFCVLTDLTDQRKQDELAFRDQRMESIGTLASGISHDLNNVLTPLMLSTQLLADGETDPNRTRILTGMQATIERGAAMIRQVLTFARGVEGVRETVDIAKVTRRFEDFCADILPKNLAVSVKSEDDLWVLGDPTQLLQVLMNLATNARDAMPEGGHLRLTAARAGDLVVIEVADDGPGMPAAVVERIFEPFFTTKGIGHGTGLGLAVSQAIARTHGGSLEVSSSPGHGTTFRMELPRIENDDLDAPQLEEAPALPSLDGARILIVDDDDAIAEVASLVIAAAGGIPVKARDAAAGQRALEEPPIDVVLTDLVMPGTSGRQFLDWLAKHHPALPVVTMSGVPIQVGASLARRNVVASLDKPFSSLDLLDAVRVAMAGRPE
ncbi:MAG: PAS domain S-box protein [Pseudolysinimonas sp.]|uniref:hybrid sensor histidine kinase/response regulator n=1 Tax=Pseudolysinimonas sp. TaxID=2680009 RepID=UPI003264074B